MDAVSNFPVTLASTDLRHGDMADDFVAATAAAQTGSFSLGRQNSHEARDILHVVLAESKRNAEHVLQNRVELERIMRCNSESVAVAIAGVKELLRDQKESSLKEEIQSLRDGAVQKELSAIREALKSLSPAPTP